MINKILGTAGTRMLNAVFNLVILIVLTRELGSSGFGIISLIILAMTILQLVIDLVAGSGIIYYTSRKPLFQLLFPAYLWIFFILFIYYLTVVFGSVAFPNVFHLVVPEGFEIDIVWLTLLNALMLTHYNLLIGQTRIKVYNTIFVVQISVLFVSVLVQYLYLGDKTVHAFVRGMYLSYGTGTLLGLLAILPEMKNHSFTGWFTTTQAVVKYGFISQVANLLHIGNKRFSFWILKYMSGLPAVGIYGAGVQLTEGLRLIGQSISLVQFSSIANQSSDEYSRQLTIRLMKLSLIVTGIAILILMLIPSEIYLLIFKKDFSDLKILIFALSPGVMALAANTIFSGYFAGIGKPKISMQVNAIGFVMTLIAAWIFIPLFNYTGAAITASLSYSTTVLVQYFIFKNYTKTTFREWIPNKSDVKAIKSILNSALTK